MSYNDDENKGETKFYPEICVKFSEHLKGILPPGCTFAYSQNNFLPNMIREIEGVLKGKTAFSGEYIPNLKLDILFGVRKKSGPINLFLLEVKYDKSLKLANFSQLAGYLQVAQHIGAGLLFLVAKDHRAESLSNEFSDILKMNSLPMEWTAVLKRINDDESHDFRIGICRYFPQNGLDWINTKASRGISSFDELLDHICS